MGTCLRWKKKKQSYDIVQPDTEYYRPEGNYRASKILANKEEGDNGFKSKNFDVEYKAKTQNTAVVSNGKYSEQETLERRKDGFETHVIETQTQRKSNSSDIEINFAIRQPDPDVSVAAENEDTQYEEEEVRWKSQEPDQLSPASSHLSEVQIETRHEGAVGPPDVVVGLSDYVDVQVVSESPRDDSDRDSHSSEEHPSVQKSLVTYEVTRDEPDYGIDVVETAEVSTTHDIENEGAETEVFEVETGGAVAYDENVDGNQVVDYVEHADQEIHFEHEDHSDTELPETNHENINVVTIVNTEPRVTFSDHIEEKYLDSPTGTWDSRLNSEVQAEQEAQRSYSTSPDFIFPGREIREEEHEGDDGDDSPRGGVSVVTVTTTSYTAAGEPHGDSVYTEHLADELNDNEANERMITKTVEYHSTQHYSEVDNDIGEIQISQDTIQYVANED